MDPLQETINAYDQTAALWDKDFKGYSAEEVAQDFISQLSGKRVIDIGCGSGLHTPYFLKANLNYIGIDASKSMIDLARHKYPTADFRLMDFYRLDFPENFFDGFWAATSLLHVPKKDLKAVLTEITRVMKSGAIGYISMKPLGDKGPVEEGFVEEQRFGQTIIRYFSFYSLEEFSSRLQEAGWEVMDAFTKSLDKNWLCYFVRVKK